MFKNYQFSLILAKRRLCRKDWNQSEDWEKLLHVKGLGGLDTKPLNATDVLLPQLSAGFILRVFSWQGNFCSNCFSLRVNCTLCLPRAVILFSDWEFLKLILLIKLILFDFFLKCKGS